MKKTEKTHTFTSNENGLRFDVEDDVTLKNITNPEKREFVSRLEKEKPKGKQKADDDNEQVL